MNVRIGNAPLDATASSTTFGAALIAATPSNAIPANATFTNLSSTTADESSHGTTVPSLHSTATVLNYVNTTPGDSGIVSMAWRSRTANEASNIVGLNDNGNKAIGYLLSDVVDLTGMTNPDGFTDKFVLEMSYDFALLNGHEPAGVNHGNIFIVSRDGSNWVNAVLGNNGGTLHYVGEGAITNNLGDYGINTTTKTVWAVLNHNSEFAVIPEPSTFVLGGLALLGLAGAGLRRRRMIVK